MPGRKRLKCQRCGRKSLELVEIDTLAGKRTWCVVCRTQTLWEHPRVRKMRRVMYETDPRGSVVDEAGERIRVRRPVPSI